jgi:hypothetical protein
MHFHVKRAIDKNVPLTHIRSVSMEAQVTNQEFAEECRQRRVDYDNLFEPRVTPAWLLKFEQQVLDECRNEMAELDLPTQAEFERRVAIMNAERERE